MEWYWRTRVVANLVYLERKINLDERGAEMTAYKTMIVRAVQSIAILLLAACNLGEGASIQLEDVCKEMPAPVSTVAILEAAED